MNVKFDGCSCPPSTYFFIKIRKPWTTFLVQLTMFSIVKFMWITNWKDVPIFPLRHWEKYRRSELLYQLSVQRIERRTSRRESRISVHLTTIFNMCLIHRRGIQKYFPMNSIRFRMSSLHPTCCNESNGNLSKATHFTIIYIYAKKYLYIHKICSGDFMYCV
jgi:hypothetical protein